MDEVSIIQYMLGIISQIKLYHWTTMKYGVHKALDDLYEKTNTSFLYQLYAFAAIDCTNSFYNGNGNGYKWRTYWRHYSW